MPEETWKAVAPLQIGDLVVAVWNGQEWVVEPFYPKKQSDI